MFCVVREFAAVWLACCTRIRHCSCGVDNAPACFLLHTFSSGLSFFLVSAGTSAASSPALSVATPSWSASSSTLVSEVCIVRWLLLLQLAVSLCNGVQHAGLSCYSKLPCMAHGLGWVGWGARVQTWPLAEHFIGAEFRTRCNLWPHPCCHPTPVPLQ